MHSVERFNTPDWAIHHPSPVGHCQQKRPNTCELAWRVCGKFALITEAQIVNANSQKTPLFLKTASVCLEFLGTSRYSRSHAIGHFRHPVKWGKAQCKDWQKADGSMPDDGQIAARNGAESRLKSPL